MTEVNLEQFALEQGITKSISAMTQQEKTMLRYQFVLEQTALAQGDFVRTQDSWANQTRVLSERWKEVKAQFGETFKAVGTLVLPVINTVIKGLGYIAQLLQSLASGVYKLFTGQELFAKETETAKDNINGAVGEQEELTEEIEKSKKAQDKFLAGFDDLQKASANVSESFEDAGLDTGFESSVPQFNLGEGKGTNELEKKKDDIIRILGEMGGYIAGALVAIGLILLVSGQIPWGLGFILAGAVTYKVSKVAEKSGYDTKAVTKALEDMAPTIAGALVAIGLILLFLSQIGWGVGFMIAGAGLYAVNEEAFGDSSIEKDTTTKLAIIGEAVSLALVSIGVILLLLGRLRWGLGFVIAGAGLLHVSEQQLGTTNITTEIQKFANENRKAIQKMGALLMVLGVLIIALSKAYFLKGLAVMLAGVGLLYTEATIDPENKEVSDTIEDFGEKHWKTIAKAGGLLVALGVLVMCTVGGFAHGLAMVVAGAGLIYTGVSLSGEAELADIFLAITEPLADAFFGVFKKILQGIVDAVNVIIEAIDAIPGVDVPKITTVWDEPRVPLNKTFPTSPKLSEAEEKALSGFVDTVPHTTILEVDGVELARATENGRRVELERTGGSSLIATPKTATRLN